MPHRVLRSCTSGLLIILAPVLVGCAGFPDDDNFTGPARLAALLSDAERRSVADQLQAPAPPPATSAPTGSAWIEPVRILRPPRALTAELVQADTAPPAPAPDQPKRLVNFERADLREAARLVFEDALGLPYAIDPTVSGEATLSTSAPLTEAALLSAFETVLAQNGAALIPPSASLDGVWRIAPRAAAAELAQPVAAGAPGFAIRVFPLAHARPSAMADILRPLLPDGAVLRADDEADLLALLGASSELVRAERLIDGFDVAALAGRSVGLFPLRAADAAALTDELTLLFELGAAEIDGDRVDIAPIARLNAVLVIADTPEGVREAEAWIARLDAGAAAARESFVYEVEHGDPLELAATLNEAFGDPADLERRPPLLAPGVAPALAASEGADPRGLAALRDGAAPVPPPPPPPPDIVVIGDGLAPTRSIRVVPAPGRRALVILAAEPDRQRVMATLRALDTAPPQIQIEATVAEVSLTDDLRFGVQFFLQDIFGAFDVNAQLTQGASASAIAPPLPGFALTIGSPIKVILDALDGVTDVNVVSSPHLMVLENQTAELNVGAEVPVARQQRQGANIDDALVNTIEFRNTGVILRVTPRVASDGTVTLEIDQEVSSVAAGDASSLTPTISTRRFRSVVLAENGATIALGGLFQTSATRTKSGVPVLQDAPLVGALFGRRTRASERTELLVLITPRVRPNAAAAAADATELREGLERILRRSSPAPSVERAVEVLIE